jgi:integrase/recombinase XerD
VPKTLPPYTEDSDIEKLFEAIKNKRSHKGCIERDLLLVEVAWRTGMRRAELAMLKKKDIHGEFLIVRGGKGGKDRTIPLLKNLAKKMNDFTNDLNPEERVFRLGTASISMKIK